MKPGMSSLRAPRVGTAMISPLVKRSQRSPRILEFTSSFFEAATTRNSGRCGTFGDVGAIPNGSSTPLPSSTSSKKPWASLDNESTSSRNRVPLSAAKT